MIQVKKNQLNDVAFLFDGIEDSMVKACLQGYLGKAYVKTLISPKAGLIVSGEYSFFGGDPNSEEAEYLIRNLFKVNESESTVGIFSDAKPDWEKRLLAIPENNPVSVPRFGIVQKDYTFDDKVLQEYIDAIDEGFVIVPFNEDIYYQALKEDWSKEFCEIFSSAQDYLTKGVGFAALKNGKLVSGASSQTVYDGGIEIQVATDEKYKQRGLALACAAALIQECAKRKIRPCWDAANLISKKMALKLGYEYKGEYITIYMRRTLK